jgi:hypothetical protein
MRPTHYTITETSDGIRVVHHDAILVAIITASNVVLYYDNDQLKMLGQFHDDDALLQALTVKHDTMKL